MIRLPIVAALAIACLSFTFSGCDQTKPNNSSTTAPDEHGHSHDDPSHADHEDHGHDHSSVSAPHGGQIIDLGRDGKYHAELTDSHDDESLTVYMLDAELQSLPIDAKTISLTLISGDDAQSFELLPQQQTDGGSSSFTISSETAFDLLESEGTSGKLRVEIDGKSFTGSFAHHEHDH